MQNPFIKVWQLIVYGNKAKILPLLALIILGAGVTVGLIASSQTQDNRQHAAETTTTTTCTTNAPTDTMLIIDKSGSMGPPVNKDDRITPAKKAAKSFVKILYENSSALPKEKKPQIGLVSFAQLTNSTEGKTTLDQPLTLLTNSTSLSKLNTSIDSIEIFGRTCIQCAVRLANEEIAAHGRQGIKKVVILLTDGGANAYDGHLTSVQKIAEAEANKEVDSGFKKSGTIFFTIGLGKDVNEKFLQDIATRTSGKYYFAPTAGQLNTIYSQISEIVGKGTISGTVFNDINRNGLQDTNEQGLSGWKIHLKNSQGNTLQTTTSTDDGTYSIVGICDATYKVEETIQSGWTQTIPKNPAYHAITIVNGNIVTDKNFGNIEVPAPTAQLSASPETVVKGNPTILTWSSTNATSCTAASGWSGTKTTSGTESSSNLSQATTFVITCKGDGGSTTQTVTVNVIDPSPTPTRMPNSTTLSFTLDFHGIGKSGDTANPFPASCQRGPSFSAANCLSNQVPKHPSRQLIVTLINQDTNEIPTFAGPVNYDTKTGNFKGIINIGNIPINKYTIKVISPMYLTKKIIENKQLVPETDNAMPETELVVGDSNADNMLSVLDYTLLLGCYSDLKPAVACDTDKSAVTDLNDDSFVNQFDYNLFLRDLPVQQGD